MKNKIVGQVIILTFLLSFTIFAQDNNIHWNEVYHAPNEQVPNSTDNYRDLDYSNSKTIFYLQVAKGDIGSANLVYKIGENGGKEDVDLSWSHNDAGGSTYDYWKCELDQVNSDNLYYVFQIKDGTDTDWAGPNGGGTNGVVHENEPTNINDWWSYDDTPLPVELSSFDAELKDGSVILNWSTATEINNYGFEVQKSKDETNWEVIEFVSGHFNSNAEHFYSFKDDNELSGTQYYRLKQIDTNGESEIFGPVEVNLQVAAETFLKQNYPNPFNPVTKISFGFEKQTKASLRVYNSLGQEVKELFNGEVEDNKLYNVQFNANNLPSGIYYYQLKSNYSNLVKKMLLVK